MRLSGFRNDRVTGISGNRAIGALAVLLVLAAAIALGPGLVLQRTAAPDVPLPFILCGGSGVVNGAEPILSAAGRPRPAARVVSSEPLTTYLK